MIGTDAPNVVTQSTWRDSNALPRSITARHAINLAISQACATKRNMHTPNQGNPRHTNCRQVLCTHITVHRMTTQMMTALLMTHSACKWRSITIKQKNKGFQSQHIWLPIWPIDCNLITVEIYIWGPGSTHGLMST